MMNRIFQSLFQYMYISSFHNVETEFRRLDDRVIKGPLTRLHPQPTVLEYVFTVGTY